MKKIVLVLLTIILLTAGCRSKQAATSLPGTKSTASVGQPCDIHSMQPYNNTAIDTGGLQCYAYGPGSPNRSAVWIMPNSLPSVYFESSSGEVPDIYGNAVASASGNWKAYTSPDKSLSFKYSPQQWVLDTSLWGDNSNILRLEEHDGGPFITIQYYPNTDFNSSPDGQYINNNFPGGTDSLNSSLQDLVDFQLNGKQVEGFIQLPQVDLGESPDQETLYVLGNNSYLKLTYTLFQNSDDFPTEAFINTIKIK